MNPTRILCGVAVLVLLAVPGALAHAKLESGTPQPGTTLAVSPDRVEAVFNEPVEPGQTLFAVSALNGTRVDRPETLVRTAQGASVHLQPNLTRGAYVIRWEALSTVDGHRSHGAWSFAVGEAPIALPQTQEAGPPYPWASAAAKYAAYVGLALLAGFSAFELVVARGTPRPAWDARVRSVARLGAWLLTLGLAAFLLAESRLLGTDPYRYVRLTSFGKGLAIRLALSILLLVAIEMDRSRPRAAAAATRALLVFAILVANGAFSHAAARAPHRAIGTAIDALHLSSGLAWAGGLVFLFLLVRPHATAPGLDVAGLTRRFSRLAQACLILVTLTGLVLFAAILSAQPRAWLTALQTPYGLLLAYKLLLAFLLMALGAANHWIYVARNGLQEAPHTQPYFRANLRREAVNAVLILTVAALLTQLSPP